MKLAWLLTEGAQGMKNQGLGLAEALGLDVVEKTIIQRFPWSLCSPYLRIGKRFSSSEKLGPSWPDLIIACGRQSILPALYVKERSRRKLIYIQDPKISPHYFDAVICPTHDSIDGPNVIKVLGTIHRVTQCLLNRPRLFEQYSRPHHVILIGGPSKHYAFDYNQILNSLKSVKEGSLLITPSRRTPPEFLRELCSIPGSFVWDGGGDNPYFDLLATADTLSVTCESVNMISEACALPVPVYLLPLVQKKKQTRISLFHQELLCQKRIRFFTPLLEKFPVKPLEARADLVKKLKEILGCETFITDFA